MGSLMIGLALWFVPPPMPGAWLGMEHRRYAVRERAAFILYRERKMRFWILRATIIGSPEVQSRCRRMLWLCWDCSRCYAKVENKDGKAVWEDCYHCGTGHWVSIDGPGIPPKCTTCRGTGLTI